MRTAPRCRAAISPDELFTLLAAGHETTATQLAWAIERLRRHPAVLSRLVDEVDSGGSDLLQATIHEVQRNRPVIDGAARQVITPTMPLGEVGDSSWVHRPGRHPADSPERLPGSRTIRPGPVHWTPALTCTRGCHSAAARGAAWAPLREHGDERACCGRCCVEFDFVPTDARGSKADCAAAASPSRRVRAVAPSSTGGSRAAGSDDRQRVRALASSSHARCCHH